MNSDSNLSEKPPEAGARRARPLWNKALKIVGIVVCLLLAFGAYVYFFQMPSHSEPSRPPAQIAPTSDKVLDAIRRGADYIERHQESDGHFSRGWLDPKPAFTALVVEALARSPEKYREKDHPFLKKAAQAIISKQRADGALATWGLGYDTYSTTASVLALTALENPEYQPVIDKATKYLLDVQYKDDEANNPNFGGPGYSKGGKTSGDMAANWVEALSAAGVKEGDPAFKNAEKFFSRLQNTESNDRPNVNGKPISNDGGFNYRPGESKVEEVKNGVHILRSYGLMSYAGLKSFIYMKIPKSDPRVLSAYKWVIENYTLDENRNIGADGLYYYYQTMAKALSLYGEPIIVTKEDGKAHDWARELSDKIISLQDADGSWYNKTSSRWLENDKVMVTSFAVRTLSVCHEFMKEHPAK